MGYFIFLCLIAFGFYCCYEYNCWAKERKDSAENYHNDREEK